MKYQITDRWHRYCMGCGTEHALRDIRAMDGNECCPGWRFERERRVRG